MEQNPNYKQGMWDDNQKSNLDHEERILQSPEWTHVSVDPIEISIEEPTLGLFGEDLYLSTLKAPHFLEQVCHLDGCFGTIRTFVFLFATASGHRLLPSISC